MPLERPQSAWLDFLDWVQEPQQGVSNLVRGRSGAAARHLADFLVGPVDAVLPGDVISRQAMPEDDIEATMLEKIALNPITWTAAVPGAGKAIGQGIRAAGREAVAGATTLAPDAMAKAKGAAGELRRTMGWDDYGTKLSLPKRMAGTRPIDAVDIDPHDLLATATGVGGASNSAQSQALAKMLTKTDPAGKVHGLLTEPESQLIFDAMQNLDYRKGALPTVLDAAWSGQGKALPDRIAAAQKRADMLMAPGADRAKIHSTIEQAYIHNENQLNEAIDRGAISAGREQGDYLHREFKFPGGDSPANATKGRSLTSAQGVVDFLAANPGTTLDRDFVGAMVRRGQKQGKMLQRAYIRGRLTNPEVAKDLLISKDTTNPLLRDRLNAAEAALSDARNIAGRDTDLGHRLKYELEGAVPQGRFADMARSVNRVFKGAAVYGVGPFVRVGSIVRNQLTAYWQLAGSPEGRAYLMRDPAMGIKNLLGAFDDGLRKNLGYTRLSSGEMTKMSDAIEAAAKNSGGRVDMLVADLRHKGFNDAADAIQHNVTQGFVLSEDMAKDALILKDHVNPLNWVIPGKSQVANIGAATFSGLEQRMRLGAFVDFKRQFLARGMSEADAVAKAAKKTTDTFLDYDITGAGNRNLRTFFPFAQFVVKSAQQQGKLLLDNPAVLPAVAALYGGDDLPDYARQQAHIGNVLPGMAPTDVFNTMPDITGSDSLEAFIQSAKPLASSAHPLIGAAIGLGTGVDTFTGRPYLKDARLPGRDPRSTERNPIDTAYGLAEDVGVAQPFAGPVQQARSLGRMSGPTAALRYATGVNVLPSQDPTTLEKQSTESALRADPRVSEFRSLYSKSQDPELQQALTRLREVQRELKQKADSTAPLGPPSGPPL